FTLKCLYRNGIVSTPCWLKIINLAEDCQSSNVLLMTTDEGVMLKVARYIALGEPLLLWFTEHIIALLSMPFLTPTHIQGQTRYICHVCHCLFEYPNPLKVHLALNCSRLDISHLWSTTLQAPQTIRYRHHHHHTSNEPSPTSFNQPPSTLSFNQPSPSSSFNKTCTSSPSSSSTQIYPNSSSQVAPLEKELGFRHSAFRPYLHQTNMVSSICPPPREGNVVVPFNAQPNPPPLPADIHAAQMETIVSNLGKSEQGHLCIYCGKVYSKKYGLKIHIRTHTGYEPLKCKYCDRPFGEPSNLNKHVRLHSDGKTPYKCELCGKILVRRRDLERHTRSRHQNNVEEATDSSSDGIDVRATSTTDNTRDMFKDRRLNKLWNKAELAGFTSEELTTLKEEFQHHQDKVDCSRFKVRSLPVDARHGCIVLHIVY
ncbi:uncharacterized protein LOC143213660, partial [Lasioglossum baleicum]|uniref:uncharacterized protein LOC143213660 n=1 Tax=Lasioglossum baleicum TaxID=434251 RepID=UPI003FCEA207